MQRPLLTISFALASVSLGICDEQTMVTDLSERLKALCANETRGYQQLLHDTTHEVRRLALERPWNELEGKLNREGQRRISARDNQHTSDYRYLVTDNGWGNKVPHSLYLEFRRRGKSLFFTVASGLDAREDWHGKALTPSFESKDTIEEFRTWGGNEWKQAD